MEDIEFQKRFWNQTATDESVAMSSRYMENRDLT
jgi:hypothetical protein